MNTRQLETIERGIIAGYKGVTKPEDSPKFLCTVEARSASGDEVWIQVFAGVVNMQYPYSDDPIQKINACGVISPSDLVLDEWEANVSATFMLEGVSMKDQAIFVDQLFTKVLGCLNGLYEPTTTIEEFEE